MQETNLEKVRMLVTKHRLTYAWLVNELNKVGVSATATELSDVLANRRRGEKAVSIIEASLKTLERYETLYVNA